MFEKAELVTMIIDICEEDAWRHAKNDPYFNEERTKQIMAMQSANFIPVAELIADRIISEIEKRS